MHSVSVQTTAISRGVRLSSSIALLMVRQISPTHFTVLSFAVRLLTGPLWARSRGRGKRVVSVM